MFLDLRARLDTVSRAPDYWTVKKMTPAEKKTRKRFPLFEKGSLYFLEGQTEFLELFNRNR